MVWFRGNVDVDVVADGGERRDVGLKSGVRAPFQMWVWLLMVLRGGTWV